MGYREDVAIAYSKEGFEELIEKMGSDLLSDEERDWAISFLDGADEKRLTDYGSRLYIFTSIKTVADDAQVVLHKLHGAINHHEYLVQYMGEDGGEDVDGGFFDNPFGIYVARSLSWDDAGDSLSESLRDLVSFIPTPKSAINQPVVDNYTCVCGNTKCSTQETSCWKCGAIIPK